MNINIGLLNGCSVKQLQAMIICLSCKEGFPEAKARQILKNFDSVYIESNKYYASIKEVYNYLNKYYSIPIKKRKLNDYESILNAAIIFCDKYDIDLS